jgi:hypothetical protein
VVVATSNHQRPEALLMRDVSMQSLVPSGLSTGQDDLAADQKPLLWVLVFCLFVMLLMVKVLWGYWERDLTLGDTSQYFTRAICWHEAGKNDFFWSPLYTAYYSLWLNVSKNAVIVTFLHRFGLIVMSTVLVAWIGLLSLPRVLAFLLVSWWLVLPIHYDTLYEVHLFSTLPVLALVIVSMSMTNNWRMPLIIGITLVTTILIRNEYVLALVVFVAVSFVNLFRNRRRFSWCLFRQTVFRYAIVMIFVGLLVGFCYSVSYVKGSDAKGYSTFKHTLNMCQVYAFGYQQRNSSWKGNPWTECSELMTEKFGVPFPTLKEMLIANPGEVARHFLWNIGLTRAGFEVLLFNATSSTDNPDYLLVEIKPVWPSVLFSLTLIILISSTILTYYQSQEGVAVIRRDFSRIGPLLLALAVVSAAVIITQRPRPSYLLSTGILYVWLVLIYVWRLTDRYVNWNSFKMFLSVSALMLLTVPSYQAIHGPKASTLNLIYNQLLPHQERIHNTPGSVALDGSFSGLIDYLRPSLNEITQPWSHSRDIVSFQEVTKEVFLNPSDLVVSLEDLRVGVAIIDPSLILKYPTLRDCISLRDAFLKSGWIQLSYSSRDNEQCIAVYIKEYE